MFDLQKQAKKDADFIESTWKKIDKKLSQAAIRSRNKIPYTSVNGVHDDMLQKDIAWWTNGFWPGLMWLMYYGTKKEDYKTTAHRAEAILDTAFHDFDGLHHDVGFMWHISSGVSYRITGDKTSYNRAMYAASILASRFNLAGGFIRAWNNWDGQDHSGSSIIDCMMNIPLLYWASDVSADPRFTQIAMSHADTVMQNHIRPDGSVKHIVHYDPNSGQCVRTGAGQGYSADSCWSRGQAWAIYGFILSYIHTGKQEYLDISKKTANYFLANITDDALPPADFRAPEQPVLYDSTAAACAACGLLELARNLPEFEGIMYYRAALRMLKTLDERCCDYSPDTDSLVLMGTERWQSAISGKGVHIPIIYGDYYFAEAIYKLKGFDLLFE